jgi:7-cyano-7-deazaguanine synthase
MNHMSANKACVLVSGGMDSIAALHWANTAYPNLIAILFDYGQQNADQELTAAGMAAEKISVPRIRIALADSLPKGRGILHHVEDHDGRDDGVSPAFVPGRNLVFLTCAAAHASVYWNNGSFDMVIGANTQDARRFPDCRPGAFTKLAETLRHGIGREVSIVAPWIDRTKTQILLSLDAAGRDAASRSWSCYRSTGPCGKCSACVLRSEAFVGAGIDDLCAPVRMTGGDPGRG